ncbi:PaaI family thioesterase [Glaciecola sp. KUL10]|uniref:PaaI family thioesterase n=1 Tax=Glaciecola sp. (strain KUL10) TaxID=2161813 RepID=UPI000D78C397|nr:PaaI family thioesterase [Glaciecola sp. KUL10]GBL05743.1 thioesterase superfamily protein [Glaciecola sp. KUL10]
MDDLLQFGEAILEAQPFSQLIGTQLNVFETGKAELSLLITDKIKQQHGFVHGGVVSYMADNCLTFAGGSVMGDSVTSEYKINFVRPAIGDQLIARASVLSWGKRQAVCECKVYALAEGKDKLVAVAQGTINRIKN